MPPQPTTRSSPYHNPVWKSELKYIRKVLLYVKVKMSVVMGNGNAKLSSYLQRKKKNAHGIFLGFILGTETELATVLHSLFHFIFSEGS